VSQRKGHLAVTLVSLVLGVMLATQFKVSRNSGGALPIKRIEETTQILRQVEGERDQLKVEVDSLRKRISEYEQQAVKGEGSLEVMKKLVDIIGSLGPITIIFTIVIGIAALVQNPGGLANVAESMKQVGELPRATGSSSAWWLAGVLYIAYNVTGSIPFLTEMGKGAATRKEAVWGAIIGSVALMTSGLLLNLALLAYIGDVAELPIPNLYFADLITPVFGLIFSFILLCEIFSTAAPMLWVAANKLSKEGTSKNKIAVLGLTLLALLGGQLPFGLLIGTVYPYTGYLGIIVLIAIAVKSFTERKQIIG
jgi:uncharacterized membrane protein YkvI